VKECKKFSNVFPRGLLLKESMKNDHFPPISHFISENIQDTAIVTVEDKQELILDLLNSVIFNDLE